MNKLDIFNDLILCMCKRAETFIITFFNVIWIKLTKLCFISIWMIQLLKFVMRKLTILVIAFLFCTNKMIVLNIWGSSFVFIIVVIQACFSFMRVFVQTFYGFECPDIESKEFPILKMEHIIRVNQRTIEASLTVSLLRTWVNLVR